MEVLARLGKLSRDSSAEQERNSARIKQANPREGLRKGPFAIRGQIQEYRENRVAQLLRRSGEAVKQQVLSVLRDRGSEITIVDKRLNSYICFANMREVLSAGDLVQATLRAVSVPALLKQPEVFLCVDIDRIVPPDSN